MTAAPEEARLVDLDPAELAARLDEALDLYVAAMGYPAGTARQRAPMWLEHSRRVGWRAVAAIDRHDALRGIAYGYPGAPGQWWYEEVRRGLRRGGRPSRPAGAGLFGAGLGRLLGDAGSAGSGQAGPAAAPGSGDLDPGRSRASPRPTSPTTSSSPSSTSAPTPRGTGSGTACSRACSTGSTPATSCSPRPRPRCPPAPGRSTAAAGSATCCATTGSPATRARSPCSGARCP